MNQQLKKPKLNQTNTNNLIDKKNLRDHTETTLLPMSSCQDVSPADVPLVFSVLSPDHHGPFMQKSDFCRDTGWSFFKSLGAQHKCAWGKKPASRAVSGHAGG